jgi:carboxymethylenebutenolidase
MDQERRTEQEDLWAEHMRREFGLRDAAATVETMTPDAFLELVPIGERHVGREAVLALYRDDLIPSTPDDIEIVPRNRLVSDGQIMDEVTMTFTFSRPMRWLLPGVEPTHTKVTFPLVVVVGFRGDLVAFERLYWDRLTLLQQIGRAP